MATGTTLADWTWAPTQSLFSYKWTLHDMITSSTTYSKISYLSSYSNPTKKTCPRVATQLWQVLLQFSKTSINMILGIDQNPVQGFLLPISPNRSQSDQRNCSDASSALLSSSSSMAQPSLSSWTTTSSSPSCP